MAVTLTVKYYRSAVLPQRQSYDLRVAVDAATDMPEEVFVMQRGAAPAPTAGAETTDQFTCIADPVDLEEYPPDAPALDQEIPYYRIKDVTFRFRSMVILEETQALIAADLQALVNSLKAAASIELSEEVKYV